MPNAEFRAAAAAALLVAACLSTACAGRYLVPYGETSLRLDYSGRRAVAVAVRDSRPRIADGQHHPSAVGETLAGGARKAPIATADGEPLSAAAAAALAAALEAAGFSPQVVETAPGDDRESIVRRASQASFDYLWLIDIEDWWTARHRRATHTYRLSFAVIDAAGGTMVERSEEGTVHWDERGGRAGGPDLPREPAPKAPTAAAPPPAVPDPDAFADGNGTAARGSPAPEPVAAEAPAPEGPVVETANDSGDPVAGYLVLLLGDVLGRMVNDPEVPRRMARFP